MVRLGVQPLPAPVLRARPRAAPIRGAASFATVRVHHDLDEVAAAFDHLRERSPASPYQQRDWLRAWIATEGRRRATLPMFVVAFDASGQPVALLPFGIVRRMGLRCAEFLGGRETNYNLGLFDTALAWPPEELRRLLSTAAALVGGLDMVRLIHQPLRWEGVDNPLAALPRSQESPSCSHWGLLLPDAEAFMRQRLSGPARKKLRAKGSHLAALGEVSHVVVSEAAAIRETLDAHLAQKSAKLASLGIRGPDPEAARAFLERACLPLEAGVPPVEVHALRCGDRIVATFGGLQNRGRFSGLFISHDQHPDYARCSPGELLLHAVLRQKCEAGLHAFDLGVGEARYKDSYCPEPDAMVDCVLPLSLRGHAAALLALAALRAKAAVKQNQRAWAAAQAFRKALGRLRR